jgi:alpha/beta superfamily hydrolase
VLGNTGAGSLSNIIKRVDWVTQNAATMEVANMSLGAWVSVTFFIMPLRTASRLALFMLQRLEMNFGTF